MANDIGIKLGVDGEKAFKQSLRDINNQFKVLGSEMKLSASQFGKNERSVESLTSANKVLEKQIANQKQRVSELQRALENSANSFGEADSRTLAWQRQLNNAEAELNTMERSLESNTREIKGMDKALKNFDDKEFRNKLTKVGNSVKRCAKVAVTAFATMAAGAVTMGVRFNAQMEQYQTSFEVMTGSAEKASAVVEELKDRAAATPFELPQLAETTQLLMNYGFTADDAMDRMEMLGDISQGSAEKMSRIAMAYGQMSSAGKVQLEDVKQMIEAGFNPLQEIADSTGESMASLYGRISKGTISVNEITDSMKRSTSEGGKYFQSMQKQSKTLNGQLSTLKDTVSNKLGQATKQLNETLVKQILPKLIKMIDDIDVDKIVKDTQSAINIIKVLSPLIVGLGSSFVTMKAAEPFTVITKDIISTKTALKEAKTGAELFNAVLSKNSIGLVIGAVAGLAAGIIALDDHMSHNTSTAKILGDSLEDFAEDTRDAYSEYENFKESMASEGAGVLLEIENMQNLKDKLFEVVDGKTVLTEKEKEQAQFYIDQLNPYLNEQIALNDLLVGSNQDVSSSIDKIIETKKAEMLLDAYKDDYIEAIKAEKEAQEKLSDILVAEAELREQIQNTSITSRKRALREELDVLLASKDEATATLEGYSTEINTYDEAFAAMADGRAGDVARIFEQSNELAKACADIQKATDAEAEALYLEHLGRLQALETFYREQKSEGDSAFRQENLDNVIAETEALNEAYFNRGAGNISAETEGMNSVEIENVEVIPDTETAYAKGQAEGQAAANGYNAGYLEVGQTQTGGSNEVYAEDMYSSGMQGSTNFAQGIIDSASIVIQAAESTSKSAQDPFKQTSVSMVDIGKQLMAGVEIGVISQKGSVLHTLEATAREMVEIMKEELDINSPSGVSEDEVGKNLALGIGVGFDKQMRSVNASIRGSVNGLVDNISLEQTGTVARRINGVNGSSAVSQANGISITQNIYTPQYDYVSQQREAVKQFKQVARQI